MNVLGAFTRTVTTMRYDPFSESLPAIRVLLLEDDALLRAELISLMAEASFAVRAAGSTDEAIALLGSGWQPSVVVIDLFLPTSEVLRIERATRANCAVPVLVVVQGADDGMLSREANSRLLIVRRPLTPVQIRNHVEWMTLHRTKHVGLAVGSLRYVLGTLVCAIGRERIGLGSDEALMLEQLMIRPGLVVSRGELFELVSGFHGDLDLRIVDVYLVRLVVKIASRHGLSILLAPNRSGYIWALDGDSLTNIHIDNETSLWA
ncbi:MAG: response regulator transcription factor [Thermomicrobiales bacterium]